MRKIKNLYIKLIVGKNDNTQLRNIKNFLEIDRVVRLNMRQVDRPNKLIYFNHDEYMNVLKKSNIDIKVKQLPIFEDNEIIFCTLIPASEQLLEEVKIREKYDKK